MESRRLEKDGGDDQHARQALGAIERGQMTTLRELVQENGASGVIMTDAGNGSGYDKDGQYIPWDEAMDAKYGDIEMSDLPAAGVSADGFRYTMASEWVITGGGDNPYRFRVMF